MERVTLLHAAALIDPETLERLQLPQPDASSRTALTSPLAQMHP